ncbi:mechanosensitive ion channel family protein [Microseira wollei]|uniref:Mechanosensitive ion channel MscS domain-containing protein n=1 Tax=Microseira wollei NIES-4236 TaxID=2530354 RepID=A0AAV3XHS1_9CYAN|nr:mechanosensitive ion channel family protein [Microseira wollei]GET40500.1 hypothetical protein MiSe_53090 [Microseira wollei NIES-4236]
MITIFAFQPILLGFLLPPSAQLATFFITLVIAALVAIMLDLVIFALLRSVFRQMENDAALVSLNVSRLPVLAIFLLLSLKFSFNQLDAAPIINGIQQVLDALLVLAVTHWITQLFTQVVISYLREKARKTEAVWDDVLVPILERSIPFLTYLIGVSIFLQTLGVNLTGIGLAVGSISVVIGLSVQKILSDFFGGLVLLVDTPFKFGDVISLNGSMAVIKNVGIRVTKLYLIDTHCEVYTPNSSFGGQDIINLSRPTPHYAYSIKIGVRVDADPITATTILREIVMGHPDILGNIDEKLLYIDKYYSLNEDKPGNSSKKEVARQRILAEKDVNKQLEKIEEAFENMIGKIQVLEKGGLESEEIRKIQTNYLEILKLVGLRASGERQGRKQRTRVDEEKETALKDSLIGLIRNWYQVWLKDPDLVVEDQTILPEEWEQKIEVLKAKMNKLYQIISNPGGQETRLDDYTTKFMEWMHENFKESQTMWKEPKIRLNNIAGSEMEFTVKFYVDNIRLEHWERGYRVNNEVRREMVRRLRQAYIYNT